MGSDLLSLSFVGLGLTYPQRALFENNEMPRLYAALSERYAFERLQHDRDGAQLEQEAQRTLTVLRNTLLLEQVAAPEIQLVKREFTDIVEVVRERLEIPIFADPRIVIRASQEAPGEDGVGLMKRASGLKDDQLDLLGTDEIHGVTLQIQAEDEKNGHDTFIEVEVGTYLRDSSRLYIEVVQTQNRLIETVPILEQSIQSAYDYLMDDVDKFAASIIRPSVG